MGDKFIDRCYEWLLKRHELVVEKDAEIEQLRARNGELEDHAVKDYVRLNCSSQEIKRLRAHLEKDDPAMFRAMQRDDAEKVQLWAQVEELAEELSEKKQRLVLLEKDRDFWASVARDYKGDVGELIRIGPDGLAWEKVTHEQIDIAWVNANKRFDEEGDIGGINALAELGIIRCEGCDGKGTTWKCPTGEDITCPDCNGHKWRIDND